MACQEHHYHLVIIIAIVIVVACFGFIREVKAQTYYATGTLVSKNLLSGQIVNSIEYFGWNATTTATTTLKVQFSQDGTNWYSATHTAGVWNELSNGDNLATSTALSLSGWSAEPNFYYKIKFETSDTSTTPILDEIKLWYNLGTYPTVTTQAPTNISTSTATANGNITSIGESSVTERGFQYDIVTSTSPAYSVSETGTFGTGTYSLNITGLYAGTTYYIRAFAKNSRGTAYGSWLSFTTLSQYYLTGTLVSKNLLANATTVSSIDYFGYNCTTNATTTLKVQFSQDGTNWYSATHTAGAWTELSDGNHLDTDRIALYGWSAEPNFYYKIKFETTNETQTPILDEIKLWYNLGTYPTVTTQAPTNISTSTATANGNITSIGESSVTERGFQYDIATSTSPAYSVSETGTFGTGTYSLNITGLYAGTTYYVRAFAKNSRGTAYGSWLSFTTESLYYTSGTLVSKNLLSGQTVINIDTFFTSSTVPAVTALWVQFSTTSETWYSANGVLNGWTYLPDGQSKIILSQLNWATPNFYYKIKFETYEQGRTPILDEIQVDYNIYHSPQLKGSIRIKGGTILK